METVKARTLDWLTLTIAGLVMLNLLPFLAPVFMEAGWTPLARGIYTAYSALCHQMAQRSFFLFGPLGFQMYEIAQLPVNLQGLTTVQGAILLHVFNHGTDHRAQALAMIDRLGGETVGQDLLTYLVEQGK